MPKLAFTPLALRDIDRLSNFLLETDPATAEQTGKLLAEALRILKHHPLIGRPAKSGYRELLISRGRSGYVALYKYYPDEDKVVVYTIRHQRELKPS